MPTYLVFNPIQIQPAVHVSARRVVFPHGLAIEMRYGIIAVIIMAYTRIHTPSIINMDVYF